MDGRGRLGSRNWDFCDNSKHAGKMLKSISGVSVPNNVVAAAGGFGHQETSLKMSSYTLRDSIIGEHSSQTPRMDLSWIPERNFISHLKCIDHPVNSEMIDIQSAPIAEEGTMHHDKKAGDSPPILEAKNQHLSHKKSGHVTSKVLRSKEPKKKLPNPTKKKGGSFSIGKREKKNQDNSAEGIEIDLSSVPVPVCSCTGVPRQCYRWGSGGWQSSCCTTTLSEYPLPMSPSRPGVRRAGRKMSIGAYGKLLQRLAAEGYDLSYAVDLKDHWARHGTNKFVTIR
ncbi:protein BASIC PENTACYSTEINE7 [Canna indica]|uniref:GAGA-binding transcriptional activator n=1 Tax=Canna indica TaxID=4628 RepID=A0AAQ3KTT4_9LILI|nr:protein BASIC PENTACYSTEINE7 [Canna indica]